MPRKKIHSKILWISSAFIVVVLIVSVIYLQREQEQKLDTVIATGGSLMQEISVTGKVQPSKRVDLAFEIGGRVAAVLVDINDEVSAGDTLMRLNSSQESANLAEAIAGVESAEATLRQLEAALEKERATLAELDRGTRPEEIRIQEIKVDNARIVYAETKKSVLDKLRDAFTRADDAIRNDVDQFILNPRSNSPKITLTIPDAQLESDIEHDRVAIEKLLEGWKVGLIGLTTDSDLTMHLFDTDDRLTKIAAFLEKSALMLNAVSANEAYSLTTINGWRTDVSVARTSINTAIANLSTVEEKWKIASSSVTLEENQLALAQAGTLTEKLSAQRAKIKEAQASIATQYAKIDQARAAVTSLRSQLTKYTLRSPIDGIIIAQNTEVGEIVVANTSVVSLISKSSFKIDVFIPEADIANLIIGNTGHVTFDAYGNDVVLDVTVSAIDPAETIIEGVSTYKTTLQFTNDDPRIKSGLTANIDILTAKRTNVLTVPIRAIVIKNGNKIVRILEQDGTIREVMVETGLRGSFGNIEILSGVSEGEHVIVFLPEPNE